MNKFPLFRNTLSILISPRCFTCCSTPISNEETEYAKQLPQLFKNALAVGVSFLIAIGLEQVTSGEIRLRGISDSGNLFH